MDLSNNSTNSAIELKGESIGYASGRKMRNNLHIGVIRNTKPKIPENFYQPVIDSSSKTTHYLLNPDYFMRVILPQGSV
jgi:hypothetical protein